MIKWAGKVFAEKLLGLLALLLVIGLIVLVWRYYHLLPTWGDIGTFILGLLIWLAFVSLLPWTTFFAVGLVNRAQSNIPAVIMLAMWAAADVGGAIWLVRGWPAAGQWLAGIVAFLVGGLYNLIAANLIARRMQQ